MSLFLIWLLVLVAAAGGFYFWAQHQGPPATGQYDGQPVPAGMYLDQESGLMLPQGTQLASPGRRIGAFFLAIPLAIITLGIGYVFWGLIVWPNGQTPALQVLGMRCFRPQDNRVASFGWMALREIVSGFVEGTLSGGGGTLTGEAGTPGGVGTTAGGAGILGSIIGLISFILMLTRPDRKTIHDLMAGTVVLYDPGNVLSGWLTPLSGHADGIGRRPAYPAKPPRRQCQELKRHPRTSWFMIMARNGQITTGTGHDHDPRPECLNLRSGHNRTWRVRPGRRTSLDHGRPGAGRPGGPRPGHCREPGWPRSPEYGRQRSPECGPGKLP